MRDQMQSIDRRNWSKVTLGIALNRLAISMSPQTECSNGEKGSIVLFCLMNKSSNDHFKLQCQTNVIQIQTTQLTRKANMKTRVRNKLFQITNRSVFGNVFTRFVCFNIGFGLIRKNKDNRSKRLLWVTKTKKTGKVTIASLARKIYYSLKWCKNGMTI